MPIELFRMTASDRTPSGRGVWRPTLGSFLLVGAIFLSTASLARAADQQVEIVFSSSAAQVAQSVTQALSGHNYELKEMHSRVALEEFCKSDNVSKPMIVLSAVEMPAHIEDDCGEGAVAKAELGYVALVLVQKSSDAPMTLTQRQIYLALAEFVASGETAERNKAKNWSDVDAALPNLPIKVFLPNEKQATRGIFDSEVMVAGCREFPAIRKIFEAETRMARCLKLQPELVGYDDTETERLAALKASGPGSVALVTEGAELDTGNSFRVIPFNGMLPTPEDIASEHYTLSIPLFLYARSEHLSEEEGIPAVRAWFLEAISERAIGENGYLHRFGFANLPTATRDWQRRAFSE